MEKIPSFSKNHDELSVGLHECGTANGVTTWDLRFKKPNAGDYLSPKALHTVEHLFTQGEMKRRVMKLWPKIVLHRGFDVLVTHAPAWQINDHDNVVHTGFKAFRRLLEKYEPKLMLHGHVHLNYGMKAQRIRTLGQTAIVNAYEKYEAEI